jgi:hypothetical protein
MKRSRAGEVRNVSLLVASAIKLFQARRLCMKSTGICLVRTGVDH